MELFRKVSEGLARKTSRRGLLGKGAGIATGALLGIAAGTLTKSGVTKAGASTVCAFPGPPCPCGGCTQTAVCAKPCVINTTWYASGCWVTAGVTCCDCDCRGFQGIGVCGCGLDYHTANCP